MRDVGEARAGNHLPAGGELLVGEQPGTIVQLFLGYLLAVNVDVLYPF